jgi:murein DD-endopeptidase MepM/ murein hydrolase activator NlpD
MPHHKRTFPVASFVVVASFVLATLTAVPTASAITAQQVKAAKAKVAELNHQIAAEQSQLDAMSVKVNAAGQALLEAQAQLDKIQAQLDAVRTSLEQARAQYDEIMTRLNARAREAFINGPGSQAEFLLGATSLLDLSDRLEYMSAVAQSDADLATQAQNLKNQLAAQEAKAVVLKTKQVALVAIRKQKEQALQAQWDREASILADVKQKKAEAVAAAKKISKKYAQQQRAALGVAFGNGVFKVCPVDQPRAFGNDFGAPRYSGGFHLHMGNDILAPMGTPIRATFDGYASEVPNTLGGLAVEVRGSTGYTYNAHLSSYSSNSTGSVQAGDIIGYVGTSGDAVGGPPHDHFEYHPNVIPSHWPPSAYGYSVIDGAINPYPLLVQACH